MGVFVPQTGSVTEYWPLSLFRSLSHFYTSMRRGSVSRRFRVVSCVSRLRRLIAVGKSHTALRYLGRFASSLSVWPCSYFSCLFVTVAAVHWGAQGDGERRGPPPHSAVCFWKKLSGHTHLARFRSRLHNKSFCCRTKSLQSSFFAIKVQKPQ